ncbi:ribosome hibernation-promoting factor, HPF/YfiA family [Pedobacter sp. SYSU D00535]|uniref:ribosome hibernation-promoting factor, HPF/YfiA family n=1 Tax=Pedobacter sp. SYSU D00535 TaxID=2810308 RepID=UPI001A95FA62|nr:ribosome-associated translation inhibitor RaiA [Pedobacter sp. SYSU D00535]
MKVRIQSIHFDADKKLLAFIQRKADKLDQFFDQVISAQVYLRLEKAEDELNKIAEIKVALPGCQLFVKEQCKTFEEATDLAMESLRRQVDRYKSKLRNRVSQHKYELSMAYAVA